MVLQQSFPGYNLKNVRGSAPRPLGTFCTKLPVGSTR